MHDESDYDDGRHVEDPGLKGRLKLAAALSLVSAALIIGGGAWLSLRQAPDEGVRITPPLVKAEPGPIKVPPEDPGGMDVPNRDKLVFESLEGGAQPPRIERLLPPPEEPLPEAPVEPEARTAEAGAEVGADDATTDGQVAPPSEGTEAASEAAESAEGGLPSKVVVEEVTPENADKVAELIAKSVPDHGTTADEASQPEAPQAAAAPVAPPAPVVKAPVAETAPAADGAPLYRVQVASLQSEAAAKDGWDRLLARHGALLKGESHRIRRADVGGSGVRYRIQIGGFADKDGADALCARFKAGKLDCFVVRD
ncbi:SPOR domain-containing protein [Oceanibacterium hippocampi]|uniref:Rare lipoprotein A n=1 Tax=Oceanibacterium hippocampi TaxID=745714 RepID=A0A1Y5TYW8_9PROT|nr:SPOR domain-containing protein [Oceanibacterium hippocampi]SLN77235.1 rare lipoprotein A [Oceanibacterium hippocampi]